MSELLVAAERASDNAREMAARAEKAAHRRSELESVRVESNDQKEILAALKQSELESARIESNDQKRNLREDSDQKKSCGAEGCGQGNSGQFFSSNAALMKRHCLTKKHEVCVCVCCLFLLVCAKP